MREYLFEYVYLREPVSIVLACIDKRIQKYYMKPDVHCMHCDPMPVMM